MTKNIFVFDVESTSLYGEGFAVGAVVMDSNGAVIEKFALMSTDISEKANDWVKENVFPSLVGISQCKTALELRTAFYDFYMKHKDTCDIYSDVNYPVETNFLNAVVKDDEEGRQWNMPYPLYDIANFVDVNIDRAEQSKSFAPRKHHPLDDAMCSAWCLVDSTLYQQKIKQG